MTEDSKIKVEVKTDPTLEEMQNGDDVETAEESASEDSAGELSKKLELADTEAKESYDRFLRISAEFENYKKRMQRELGEFRKYANESLIKELLNVVDNLERAVASSSDAHDHKQLMEGVDLTLKEILKIFEKYQVKAIEAMDREFDPTVHQAMLQEVSENHPENTVIREFQRGYTIHDRLLRPAMVVVSKAAEAAGEDAGPISENQ